MPFIRNADAVTYDVHGASFIAYANPASGSRQLCAWLTQFPAGATGVGHSVSHEEVFRVMSGRLRVTFDSEAADLDVGDVAVATAGTTLRIDNVGDGPASIWVTTSVGLRATMADGSEFVPPWTK